MQISRGYLEGKSCLFFGSEDCTHSKACLDHLKSLRMKVFEVFGHGRNKEFPEQIVSWSGDFIFSYRNYWLLPIQLISSAKLMAVNFHTATPEYPGSGTYNWAIYEGSRKFGITVHLMNEKFDNGKIIQVYPFNIDKHCTVEKLISLTKDYSVSVFTSFVNSLDSLSDEQIHHLKEKTAEHKWDDKVRRIKDLDEMRKLDLSLSKEELDRRIRAFHSDAFPCYFLISGKHFKYSENIS